MNFRREIDDHLSATLLRDVKRQFPRLYDEARTDLQKKLRLYGETEAAERLPERCPYTLDQVLGDFWPVPRHDVGNSG